MNSLENYQGTIQAKFNKSIWMNGKITKVTSRENSQNLFTVEYENGAVEDNVPESLLREVPLSLEDLKDLQESIQRAFDRNPLQFMFPLYRLNSKSYLLYSDIFTSDEAPDVVNLIQKMCKTSRYSRSIHNEVHKSDVCLVCIVSQSDPKDPESGRQMFAPFIINSKGPSFVFTYEDDEVHEIVWGEESTYFPKK